MDVNEAIQYCRGRAELVLEKAKKEGYICPICGSGSGKNGTGITSKDKVHFTCWAGCFRNADIIDIMALKNGISADADIFEKLKVCENVFGFELTDNRQPSPLQPAQHRQSAAQATAAPATASTIDYHDYYLQCAARIDETDYHRGLSEETLRRYMVGYDPEWISPTAAAKRAKEGKPPLQPSPRLIIPVTRESYFARATDDSATIQKQDEGGKHLYDPQQVCSKPGADVIFVCEAALDALSCMDLGYYAASVQGVGGWAKLIPQLQKCKQAGGSPIIAIAFDKDPEGSTAAESVETNTDNLKKELEKIDIPCTVTNRELYRGCKDLNELLITSREGLSELLKVEKERALSLPALNQAAQEVAKAQTEAENVANNLTDIIDRLARRATLPAIPTGYSRIDRELLDGGLYAGLYTLGAVPSLGKTTFSLQAADQIAAQGYDVIIFSLEMSSDELVCKSLSRLSFIQGGGLTTRDVQRMKDFTQIGKAADLYSDTSAKHIYISESVGATSAGMIRERIEKHVKTTGRTPVIFIDYLQILASPDPHLSDKQAADVNILELKRISRDFGTPVVVISSFNRENYSAGVNMAAFKESGAIEYSSDVLIGLQYYGMKEKGAQTPTSLEEIVAEAEKAGREGRAQKIELKVLKNRNGVKGGIVMNFYPKYNYFTDEAETEVEKMRAKIMRHNM